MKTNDALWRQLPPKSIFFTPMNGESSAHFHFEYFPTKNAPVLSFCRQRHIICRIVCPLRAEICSKAKLGYTLK
jgi:hypothetical protein